MFKIILLIIVIFALYNLKNIIDKKRNYLIIKKDNKSDNDKKTIKQYGNYLTIIDTFIVFLFMLFIFNLFLLKLNKFTNTSIIIMASIIFFTLIDIIIVLFFKYNEKYQNNIKKINIFYYLILFLIIFIGLLGTILASIG